jgi:hypothetical protein
MNTTEVSLAVFCWCVYGLGAIGIMEIDRIYPRPSNPRVWWRDHRGLDSFGAPGRA